MSMIKDKDYYRLVLTLINNLDTSEPFEITVKEKFIESIKKVDLDKESIIKILRSKKFEEEFKKAFNRRIKWKNSKFKKKLEPFSFTLIVAEAISFVKRLPMGVKDVKVKTEKIRKTARKFTNKKFKLKEFILYYGK